MCCSYILSGVLIELACVRAAQLLSSGVRVRFLSLCLCPETGSDVACAGESVKCCRGLFCNWVENSLLAISFFSLETKSNLWVMSSGNLRATFLISCSDEGIRRAGQALFPNVLKS